MLRLLQLCLAEAERARVFRGNRLVAVEPEARNSTIYSQSEERNTAIFYAHRGYASR